MDVETVKAMLLISCVAWLVLLAIFLIVDVLGKAHLIKESIVNAGYVAVVLFPIAMLFSGVAIIWI